MKKILFILTFTLTFSLFSCKKNEDNNEFTYEIKEYNGPKVTKISTDYYSNRGAFLCEDYKSTIYDTGYYDKWFLGTNHLEVIDFNELMVYEGFKYNSNTYTMYDGYKFSNDLVDECINKLFSLNFFDLKNDIDKKYESKFGKSYVPNMTIEFEDSTKVEYVFEEILISNRVIKEISKIFEEMLGKKFFELEYLPRLGYLYSKIHHDCLFEIDEFTYAEIEDYYKFNRNYVPNDKNATHFIAFNSSYNEINRTTNNYLEYIKNNNIVMVDACLDSSSNYVYRDTQLDLSFLGEYDKLIIKSYDSNLSDETLIYEGNDYIYKQMKLRINPSEGELLLTPNRVYHLRFEYKDNEYLEYGFYLKPNITDDYEYKNGRYLFKSVL